METTQELQPKPAIYKGKEYTIKPYTIEMGMAYDLYIEPHRFLYSQNFADAIDIEYLDKYDVRINELKDTISSFDEELNDEQKAAKANFEQKLAEVETEKLLDEYAQKIISQSNDIYNRAYLYALNQKTTAIKFLNAVVEGGVKDIEFGTEEYYNFALTVLTNFFLLKTATQRLAENTPISTP